MSFNKNFDYGSAIEKAIKRGAKASVIQQLQRQRNEKINSNRERYGRYEKDGTNKLANNYVATSQRRQPQPQQRQSHQSDLIRQIAEQQKQQQIAGLTKSYSQNVSNLNAEKTKIQPTYYNARNDASTLNKIKNKNFAEFMANRGTTQSGENVRGRELNSLAYQNTIGNLKNSEANAYSDIEKRLSDLSNAYNSDVQSANAGVNATMMQNLVNQSNTDRQFDYRQQRDNIADGYRDRQFDWNKYLANLNQSNTDRTFNYNVQRDNANNQHWREQFDWNKHLANLKLNNNSRNSYTRNSFAQISKKEQTENYFTVKNELNKLETKDEAIKYINQIRDYLSDSDYKKLYDDAYKKNEISNAEIERIRSSFPMPTR